MKIYIHGNCQAMAMDLMLREVRPDWPITHYEVHTDKILAEIDNYHDLVRTADVILTQPVHDGYRDRPDLALSWIRAHAKPDAKIVTFPSMHFEGQLIGVRSLPIPAYGMPSYHDVLLVHLVASGIPAELIEPLVLSPDLYDEAFLAREIEISLHEARTREREDEIDVKLSPFLETFATRRQMFHVTNHPCRPTMAFVANAILERLGMPPALPDEGTDYLWFPHIPWSPSFHRYFERRRGGDDDLLDLYWIQDDKIGRHDYVRRTIAHLQQFPRSQLTEALRYGSALAFLQRALQAHPSLPGFDGADTPSVAEPSKPDAPLAPAPDVTEITHAAKQGFSTENWPTPNWSPARLLAIRELAISGDGSLFHVALARIRMLAAAGALEAANLQLAQLVQTRAEPGPTLGELRDLVPVALMLGNLALARQVVGQHFQISDRLRFEPGDEICSSAFLLRVEGATAVLRISRHSLQASDIESTLQRLTDILPLVVHYLDAASRVDGQTMVNVGDAGETPGLTFCDNRPGFFPIPDSIYMDLRGYAQIRAHYARQCVPWHERALVAFWRGSTTGIPRDQALGWRSLPRVRLCEIAAENRTLMDAGITRVGQFNDPEMEPWLAERGLLRPHVDPTSFQTYRYQIDIDGNTTSWPGLFMKLLTGSPVLKVPPRDGYEQWYYHRLKPWINFVPVAADMSDLVEKITWLQANDDAARRIGEAGLQLAADLSYDHEISRAAPIIAAAMRHAAGLPLVELDFTVGGNGARYLREGWLPAGAGGTYTSGFQCRAELCRPPGIGGFIIGLVVSPAVGLAQSVSVVIDGAIAITRLVEQAVTLYVPLSRTGLSCKKEINVSLLLPDAATGASSAHPGCDAVLSLRLERIFFVGVAQRSTDPQVVEAAAELGNMDNPHAEHDIRAPCILPPAAILLPLYAHDDQRVYVNVLQGRLLHDGPENGPQNLFLAALNGLTASGEVEGPCKLVRTTASGLRWLLRLRPDGDDGTGRSADGLVEDFCVARAPHRVPGVTLAASGVYLCADSDGQIRLNRPQAGAWETFRIHASQPANK